MRCSSLFRRESSRHSERHLAIFHLLAQTVELRVLPGVGADGNRVEGDPAFFFARKATNRGDTAPIAYCPDHKLVQDCAVDETVGPLRN